MKKIIKIIICIVLTTAIFIIFKENITSLLLDIKNSFYQTIINEKRYILIFEGLKATLIISVLSIIIGTIIGLLLFWFSKFKIIKSTYNIFVKIMQGTPITVLLLIFYYVIFGKLNINPLLVAIIAFSIYFSAYVAEIIRGAYLSLNKSQIYSAHSLGFNKWQTVKYIVLPQMLAYTIPVFKNQGVSLIKLTSIAGYISIMELTKASDIIRNRTYEPFFPLIMTAIIYYIICSIFGKILDCFYKKVNHRKVKYEK